MAERRIDAFFYGLFMNSDILKQSDVIAKHPRRGFVDGFALRIGQRASLVPADGARSYGMIFSLTHNELDRLYTAPGLEHYRPEALIACELDGDLLPVLCYILLEPPAPDEANEEYASSLRATLRRLDFPPEYVASVV